MYHPFHLAVSSSTTVFADIEMLYRYVLLSPLDSARVFITSFQILATNRPLFLQPYIPHAFLYHSFVGCTCDPSDVCAMVNTQGVLYLAILTWDALLPLTLCMIRDPSDVCAMVNT